jgi:hypothetical protein
MALFPSAAVMNGWYVQQREAVGVAPGSGGCEPNSFRGEGSFAGGKYFCCCVSGAAASAGPREQRQPRGTTKAARERGFLEAGDRARTGDPQLGKLMLYQLSYTRVMASILASSQPCKSTSTRRWSLGNHRDTASMARRRIFHPIPS